MLEYATGESPDGTVYLSVRESQGDDHRALAEALEQPGPLRPGPVAYRGDGTVRETSVGPASAVQAAVESVPETMGVDVLAVGEYDAGRLDPLTSS